MLTHDNAPYVCRISDIEQTTKSGSSWLIHSLWLKNAVGFCGGPPKCRKSWFGIEAAVAVASGVPCLGRFAVDSPGPALIYMAEDSLSDVKERVRGICQRRRLDIDRLDLHVITTPRLLIDEADHRKLLIDSIEMVRPKFLLLDPLVRIHRLDENHVKEISGLLQFFRVLQRQFDVSIMITHHANKKTHGRPGERLRGSSDLYAFADSAVYLFPKRGRYELTVEHRSAAVIEPFFVDLVTEGGNTSLEIAEGHKSSSDDLPQRILETLRSAGSPITRTALRTALRVKNQTLGECLDRLASSGLVSHSNQGWGPTVPSSLFDC